MAKNSLDVTVLCSSTRVDPDANSAIAFAKYIVSVKDHLRAFGFHETPSFLHEAVHGESHAGNGHSPLAI